MSSLQNLQRVTYTNEMVMTLIKLYQFHGKEFYYENVLKTDAQAFIRDVVSRDTTALVNFFKLNVTEHRLKLIIKSDSEPKTNDEKIARNLRDVISLTTKNYSNIEFEISQVRSLVELIYKDVKRVQYEKNTGKESFSLLTRKNNNSREEDLRYLFDLLNQLLVENQNEITNLICNFYIDFINLKPFKENNDLIAMVLIYVFLFKKGFTQFKYVSFFELLLAKKDEFLNLTILANYDWEKGFSKVEPLNNFIVSILLYNYAKMESIILDYTFDSKLNKSNNIEITILILPQKFTKGQIAKLHPTISESTNDRNKNR